jgi:DNA sulfur modification protein DndC
MLNITPEIQDLIDAGALFVINDSAGKDSQAMKALLIDAIPASQLLIIHAILPEVDWPGCEAHVEKYAKGVPVLYAQAKKTFFEMVEHRGMFPSPQYRQCTSDLKRGPIQVQINRYARENGHIYVVNCMGMRAEESSNRAKLATFRFMPGKSAAHRQQYEWLPIHHMSTAEVWQTIADHGQEPHWAYAQGMERLSCCFCIMASENDIRTAARLMPELAARYMETERRLNFTLLMPNKDGGQRFLDQIVPQK